MVKREKSETNICAHEITSVADIGMLNRGFSVGVVVGVEEVVAGADGAVPDVVFHLLDHGGGEALGHVELEVAVLVKEEVFGDGGAEEHVVVEVEEAGGDAGDVAEVGLDGVRVEGGEVAGVLEDVLVRDEAQARRGGVDPVGDLAVRDEDDVAHPRHELGDGARRVLDDAVVAVAAVPAAAAVAAHLGAVRGVAAVHPRVDDVDRAADLRAGPAPLRLVRGAHARRRRGRARPVLPRLRRDDHKRAAHEAQHHHKDLCLAQSCPRFRSRCCHCDCRKKGVLEEGRKTKE